MSHHRSSPDQPPYYPPPHPPYQPQYTDSAPTRPPRPMAISLPQFQPLPYPQQQSQPSLTSPYETPLMPMSSTPLSAHHEGMVDYFSIWNGQNMQPVSDFHQHSFQHHAPPRQHSSSLSLQNQSPNEWQSQAPRSSRKTGRQPNSRANGSDSTSSTKTTRQQFTACGACRHRRVKCDLKDKQEQVEKTTLSESGGRTGPMREQAKKIQCSNCLERGLNCVDEFAPIKAAKQLRRGKRITEIEQLYGKSASNSASVHDSASTSSVDQPLSSIKSDSQRVQPIIPKLTREFFESDFFQNAILCHVLYAWAVSYGVDEYGGLDLPEGGREPLTGVNVTSACPGEAQREKDRSVRMEKMKSVVEVILKEIDDCGVMRKPTWDGVRVLLMILPLTEGISTPVERLAMYDAAISQVFMLCSHAAMGYDGQPSATAAVNGGTEDDQGMTAVRVRVYWYAFVHEGITTGLKGGRLRLDDEDLETMQDIIDNNALVRDSVSFRISTKFATAPINFALACRKINKALTGPKAKRRITVNVDLVKQAWEALESCWEELNDLLKVGPDQKYILGEEVARQVHRISGSVYFRTDFNVRFADGWKIFLFEAQNVIYNNLEARRQKLSDTAAQVTARITESVSPSSANSPEAMHADLIAISHLLDIAKSKCEVKTRQIVDLVKMYVGTRFFEWDASLVRDGTYYAAMWLVKQGGSSEDVAVCIQALNNSYPDQPRVDITHPVPITPYSSQPSGISGPQHQAESSHISTADSTFTSSHTTPPINDTKVNVMDMPSNYHHVHTREGFFEGDSFHPSQGAQQTQIYEEAEMRNESAQSHHGLVGHGHGDIMLGGHGYRTYEKFDGQTGYTAVEGYSQSRQVHQDYQFHHNPSHLHPHVLPATRDGHTLETGHGDYSQQHHTEESQERKELQGQYVLQYDGTYQFPHDPSHIHPHVLPATRDGHTLETGHGDYSHQHHTEELQERKELQGQYVLQYDGTHVFTPYPN
ncbi:hypothetical protein I313_03352 [Cryptococcus deuterogattii Ram5]|uniref:Unplaced genomic scaffold supercont1.7, whole genome shotgun sequence n=1 Tax=Cryptococcus deuterogattii Ram5 TaxID=1296110 RepID=A0A0D0UZM5_9TREE|nr:hypothetical protein I313_03352 [Cryptococcus deuterogattii Ram5]